jgi:nucleotide-binding universal stress UspA family protein
MNIHVHSSIKVRIFSQWGPSQIGLCENRILQIALFEVARTLQEFGVPHLNSVMNGIEFDRSDMKLVIAYDGSDCAEEAIDDLSRAGISDSTEAIVICVAEVWLPSTNLSESADDETCGAKQDHRPTSTNRKNGKTLEGAITLANYAKKRLESMFPIWHIESNARSGSPACEILAIAQEINADLIVVGSHGSSSAGRFFLGSISQKVLTEAQCSVRIGRQPIHNGLDPIKMIIGFDGSNGSHEAINAVNSRWWIEQSTACLLTVSQDATPAAIGRFVPPICRASTEISSTEREWIEKLSDASLFSLRNSGISADMRIRTGNPKDLFVEEAESWEADCIFVGANALGNRVDRSLLGSTAAAVAARAKCSVEVVRQPA